MTTSVLLELYRKDPSGKKAIVVQNLQDDVREDNLLNYLEVICTGELTDVYFPLKDCRNVAIAVFAGDVTDIDKFKDKAAKKKFGGSFLSLQTLDQPDGIFIENVPDGVSEEYLSLYFESKRYGGEEDTVKCVTIYEVCSGKHGAVEITSTKAISSILSIEHHVLRKKEARLEPYYASVHKCLTTFPQARQDDKEVRPSPALQGSITCERTNILGTAPQIQPQIAPTLNTLADHVDTSSNRKMPSLRASCNAEEQMSASDRFFYLRSQSKDISGQKVQHSNTYSSNFGIVEPPVMYDNGSGSAKSDFKLKIISDDPIADELEEQVNNQRAAVSKLSYKDEMQTYDNSRNYGFTPYQSTNTDAVKPVVRNFQRQVSSGSDDGSSRKRKPKRKGQRNTDSEQQTLPSEEELDLPSVQIIMLIIFRFQKKTENNRLKVVFKEKNGKVIIKGSTVDDVIQAKIKLYECINSVVSKSEILSSMRSTFLARECCRNCLRVRCIQKKIRSAFEVDASKREILAYAFSYADAERGLEFVNDEVKKMALNLRPGQDQYLKEAAWTALIDSLDNGLTTVYRDESTIVVESFNETKAKDAFGKVVHFLKQHVKKDSSEVVLESAKARCFQTCLENKLKQEVERKRGKFDVEEQSRSPFKIRIRVEGEESLTSALTQMVNQIWHENLDFSKISDRAEDRWLLFKGLDGSAGINFLKTFERNHNCFIQVSKEGEFRMTKPRVQVDDDAKTVCGAEDDEDVIPSTDRRLRNNSDDELVDDEAIPYHMRKKHILFQAGMNEDEAVGRAIAMSLEDGDKEVFDEDQNMLPYKICNVDELSALRRRQSEREMETSPQIENVRRSISSPLIGEISPVRPKSETLQMLRITVNLVQGEIVRQKAEALVNIVSPSHDMKESVVSKAFVKSAGVQIIQLYAAARGSSRGIVVKTGACGRLKCSSVLHVALVKGEAYCQKMIRQAMSEVFQECRNEGYESVAFPPLGVGRMYKYPAETVAERMLEETYAIAQSGAYGLNQITFVVFDDETYKVFERQFKTFDARSINEPTVPLRRFYRQDPIDQGVLLRQKMLRQQQMQQSLIPAPLAVPSDSNTFTGQSASRGMNSFSELKQTLPSYFEKIFQMKRAKDVAAARQSRLGERVPESKTKHGTVSSAHGSDIYQRKHRTERVRPHGIQQDVKQRRSPRSRFPDKKRTSNLRVIVIAETKNTCIRARNELEKRIKEEFLHEEKIDKRQKISDYTKKKIVNIIIENDIESIKEKGRYILRGCKDKVAKARTDILELLLEEKDNTEKNRKRKGNLRRETQDFVTYMVEEEPEVPPYWNTYKSDVTLKSLLTSAKHAFTGKNYEKVELTKNSQAFAAILNMINSSFDQSKIGQGQDARGLETLNYTRLVVVKIQRIENLDLYEKFTGIRQKLFRRLLKSRDVRFPKIENLPNCSGPIQTSRFVNSSLNNDLHPEINEVLLFHGTKKENVETICSSGLDPRLGSGKAMFGSGIYGAECSTKADQYADDKTNRTAGHGNTKKMFLIRMLLGNGYLCSDQNPHKYRRPPCTSCFMDDCKDAKHAGQKFGHMFDSVLGDNGKLFREFVVYDASMCYPEYVITYERQ